MITCIVELALGIILLMEPVTKLGTHYDTWSSDRHIFDFRY